MNAKDRDAPSPPIWLQPPPPTRHRTLSREEIVRAAIEVADAGGAEAITMSAVARQLGSFSPMSLYRYVHSKDGLVDLMLDAVNGQVVMDGPVAGDWRGDLYAIAARTWTVLKRHPWVAQLIHTRPPVGPNALRRLEFMLAAFTSLGQDPGAAMGYASMLERHIIGLAMQQAEEEKQRRHYDFSTPEATQATLQPLRALIEASDRYPNLTRWADAPAGLTIDEQFELGLHCLLDGIAARMERR